MIKAGGLMLKINCLGRKGFALQFTWLFVLIAGAVILGFFFSLINNLMHDEDVETNIKATQELDSLLKINLASGDTQKIVSFDKKIIFSGDGASTYSEYYAEDSPHTARYDYNAIFSPSELEGDELIIQTLMFRAPFRTLPVVYVSNKDVEYVFVNTSPIINLIDSSMPENLTKNSISRQLLFNYSDNNYDHTVFILDKKDYLVGLTLNHFRNPDKRLFAVVVTPGQDTLYGYGNLSFYHYTSATGFVSDGSVPFLDLTLLVGGVISHDKELYECNLRKVLRRINLLCDLHIQRLAHYHDDASLLECKNLYISAIAHLENIKTNSRDGEKIYSENIQNMLISINELRSLNNYIIGAKDCPGIY